MLLFTAKPGIEKYAISETTAIPGEPRIFCPGLIGIDNSCQLHKFDPCFISWQLSEVQTVNQEKNPVESIALNFCDSIRDKRIEDPWILNWLSISENGCTPVLSKSEHLRDLIRKKVSRVAKLAKTTYPFVNTPFEGLTVLETVSGTVYISQRAVFYGQKRMKDDPAAPSRSYLKVEEAFSILGRYPSKGEHVADLGAAPGGWSWAAAKRGAQVFAIDNGPLKRGAQGHPLICHIRTDAFNWQPQMPVDWLFCDMVERPSLVLNRIRTWFSKKWCRFAVVNFKFGYADPVELLNKLHSSQGLEPFTKKLICRQLFHDRDEFTVIAELNEF
jgi:23S rRNA (cytidine2498-2'-O)-methyltransferase